MVDIYHKYTKYMSKAAKIVFAGQTNVGKSSIVYRIYGSDVNPYTTPTIGAAFIRKRETRNNETVCLDIWDTAGQERYRSISTFYFRSAIYCILVFDLSDAVSFQNIHSWKQLSDNANLEFPTQPIYILIGNKSDLKNRAVSADMVKEYCRVNNIHSYVETSAWTGAGVSTLYDMLVTHIFSHGTATLPSSGPPDRVTKLTSNGGCAC